MTDPDWMTVPQAAAFVGVSRSTMVTLLDRGEITSYTPSKHRRVKVADLKRFLTRKKQLAEMSERLPEVPDLLNA